MNSYFDSQTYFSYLLEHCTEEFSADGKGRLAGGRQLLFFLDQLDIRPEHATLEVGCGTGRVLTVLAERYGVEPHGVDPCRPAVDYLHRQHPDWAPRIAYAPDGVLTSLPGRFFDRIVFWGVFELTDQVRTLVEISRAAKPGARILVNGVRNADFRDDDTAMAEAVAAYRDKRIPIMLTRIDRLEALMAFLGFSIDRRFIFLRKDDVVEDRFEADRDTTRFAEATYILSKSETVPADLDIAATAY